MINNKENYINSFHSCIRVPDNINNGGTLVVLGKWRPSPSHHGDDGDEMVMREGQAAVYGVTFYTLTPHYVYGAMLYVWATFLYGDNMFMGDGTTFIMERGSMVYRRLCMKTSDKPLMSIVHCALPYTGPNE